MKGRRFTLLAGLASLIVLLFIFFAPNSDERPSIPTPNPGNSPAAAPQRPPPVESFGDENISYKNPAGSTGDDLAQHPIERLIQTSREQFKTTHSRQSKTLQQAATEYRRRYGLHPPPHFDVWFKFAQSRGVQMIDEYDTIYHTLLPFWGVKPKTIRERAREAIGFENALIGLMIRDGNVTLVDGGGEGEQWKRDAIKGMMATFVKYLPDMDLAFNIHDEPRVVMAHSDLSRLVAEGKHMAASNGQQQQQGLQNRWSARPEGLNKGDRIDEVRRTRFNRFAHQPTWTNSRMSCPPDSPARQLEDEPVDNTEQYSTSPLGFISNTTAFSDVCLTPSLRQTFGFFERPNALDIVHDLFPIFSQSKVSSFQDILYPSPWYWNGNVAYDANQDMDWSAKEDQMYWRGSTTGGFSRAGGWRRQHRQLFVRNINSLGPTNILEKSLETGRWAVKQIQRNTLRSLFNVSFSHVGQCDPEDCEAQKEYFTIVKPAKQQDAWKFKYLVDIDGNAFSGRYYAFLLSKSLVYKLALFREWHDEWLRPWVHFIPLSFRGTEHYESVRYFAKEEPGKDEAIAIAQDSQKWARKVLRNEDLEVWFFRLLLEYGRVIDDNRERLGFSSG
ncbi:hypothetical protein H109_06480 [Trichophyton interdigitale MR816]|uniref:Glycosyl transferase CAP10 domain-containing protein n=1 Tax=Trichophyton interdigitale (strain MR816) TaxID=1215338 RepID=A0A059J162_TRIIM|nr:hypothetical protein H101_02750 [Trichophyton interdigitale H6]KDB21590.1 hypothetical protein H109_06480 [Trichophyton interdigitale MR816]